MIERKVFTGSVIPISGENSLLHGLTASGQPVDKTTVLHLVFSLQLDATVHQHLEDLVASGKVLTPAQLKAGYIPDQQQVGALVDWLKSQGYVVTKVSPNGTGVYASGTISLIESSLQVSFVNVIRDGLTYPAATSAPSLPADLAGIVHAVIGLQPFRGPNRHGRAALTVPAQASAATAAPAPTPVPNQPPYMVNEILKAYNADGLDVTGAGQTIAILIDTFPNDTDLTQFWAQNNLPVTLAQIQKVQVGSGALPAPEGEETLDVEWASGIAPGATIRIYAAGGLQYTQLDQALDAILADVQTIPGMRQVSISLGFGETYMGGADGVAAVEHQKFLRLAALGVNVFVSAGDAGSNPDLSGENPIGPMQVEYAASDSGVIAVGGTSLSLAGDGGVSDETAWSLGGGGISTFFDRPSWQKGVGMPDGTMRLVPDVSLTADPGKGGLLILNGKVQQYGGTSWAAPMWAAFSALINEARQKAGKPFLPYLNPLLYPLMGTTCFREIVTGCNGAYDAGKGYNMITGIGVPDVKELIKALG